MRKYHGGSSSSHQNAVEELNGRVTTEQQIGFSFTRPPSRMIPFSCTAQHLIANYLSRKLSRPPHISNGGRTIYSLPFADDIDTTADTNSKLQGLNNRLTNSSNGYGIETSTEKSKSRPEESANQT